jgi:hypothetical protein
MEVCGFLQFDIQISSHQFKHDHDNITKIKFHMITAIKARSFPVVRYASNAKFPKKMCVLKDYFVRQIKGVFIKLKWM